MVVRDRGVRRLNALVRGLSPEACAWPPEEDEPASRPAVKLAHAAHLIGG